MALKPLTAEAFEEEARIAAPAMERLRLYVSLLEKWQAGINLVSRASLEDVWRRHVWDSAQLLPLIPAKARRLADLGSGAGFPGMVLAILGAPDVHLVESDHRKAAFLADVSRETSTPVSIHCERIEMLPGLHADVVSSRACAPLVKLLGLVRRHLAPRGMALLLKGRRTDEELTEAAKEWKITAERIQSLTDASGVILRVGEIQRRHDR